MTSQLHTHARTHTHTHTHTHTRDSLRGWMASRLYRPVKRLIHLVSMATIKTCCRVFCCRLVLEKREKVSLLFFFLSFFFFFSCLHLLRLFNLVKEKLPENSQRHRGQSLVGVKVLQHREGRNTHSYTEHLTGFKPRNNEYKIIFIFYNSLLFSVLICLNKKPCTEKILNISQTSSYNLEGDWKVICKSYNL